uniref:RRM domain-containing protein n=1 Tax=Davidia involucrata TaxID=16924 RepID=A0A5B7BIG9_DAVIN
MDLTVRVLDLSPKVTHSDLNMFFSYCGTIRSIQIHRNKDQTQLAFVTFRQPYAYQTALLLNGAIIAGRPIRILTFQNAATPPMSYAYRMNNENPNNESQEFIPAMESALQSMGSKGIEMLNRTKDELEENYKLSEKGKALVEQTARCIDDTVIRRNQYISTGAVWLSGVLDKASKYAYELSTKKTGNPTFMMQK